MFPEHKLPEMIGLDQTLYLRFVRGCCTSPPILSYSGLTVLSAGWFTLLHTFTTLPVLLPIHLVFADSTVSPHSMNRASLTALITQLKGVKLLWVHQILLYWLFVTWVTTIWWIVRGLFRYRKRLIRTAAEQLAAERANPELAKEKPLPSAHPHTPHAPNPDPVVDRGLRLRTIMVSNVPVSLRSESELRDYFIYHMSKSIYGPALTHGFLPRVINFILRRKPAAPLAKIMPGGDAFVEGESQTPIIERVVIARKMSELQSQLERREEVLRKLEANHLKLARRVLTAVKERLEEGELTGTTRKTVRRKEKAKDPEQGKEGKDGEGSGEEDEHISKVAREERMKVLVEALGPFVKEFTPLKRKPGKTRPESYTRLLKSKPVSRSDSIETVATPAENGVYPPPSPLEGKQTIWDVLHSLPRDYLDPYQPLTSVNTLFRGATVPSIDYHTAKLGLITSLINENRSRLQTDYTPASTAFVTFHNPRDALRAVKFLPCHPDNPLVCLVEMAPDWRDLDWERVGKSTFTGEFIRDWVVKLGVWGFTLFWVIPVSSFVALVSIDKLGAVIPALVSWVAFVLGFLGLSLRRVGSHAQLCL
jgi:Cytosolic domain of 10TM putative phosphate transporter